MSVRPSVAFVCGINDGATNDPRYKKPKFDVWESQLEHNADLFAGQKELWFDKVYICGNPMCGLESFSAVGYVISCGDEDLARGLNLALNLKTQDTIMLITPDENPSKFTQQQYSRRDGADVVESANKENRWYETMTPWYTDLYFRRAIYVLRQAGWVGVTRDMLKFMIVLYWS